MSREITLEDVESVRAMVVRSREKLAGVTNAIEKLETANRIEYFKHCFLSIVLAARNYFANKHEWRLIASITMPLTVLAVIFVMAHTVSLPNLMGISIAVLAGIVSAAFMSVLLFVPSTATIKALHEKMTSTKAAREKQLAELKGQKPKLESQFEKAEIHFSELDAEFRKIEKERSREHKLRRLHKRNWRAMRSVDFEEFLAEVFETLGYEVETTNTTSDQGVDLLIARDNWRIAVQVKGYKHSVGNSAVQEAYAGMAHYKCDACAVATNSLFTNSARSLASSTSCVLIDENNMFNFIIGRFDLVTETRGKTTPHDITKSESK